jgi:drug/metabolite transporter (DMT)-like permease
MSPLVHVALGVVQILFASLAIVGRVVLPEFPAGVLTLSRVLGATTVLLAVNALRGGPWVRDRRDLLALAGLGTLGIALNQTLFLYGLRHTTAVNATILVTTVPVFTVLGSVLLGREPPSALKFAGIGLAALGAVWLIGPDRITLDPATALGNGLIVLGMVCYAAYFIFSKPLMRRLDAVTATTYVMLFGAIGVLPLGAASLRGFDPAAVRGPIWAGVAFIVVFPTIVTYLLNLWALRRATPNVVAAYIYLQPVMTAAVAPLVLSGERLTTRAIGAGLAIFAGLAMVLVAERAGARAGAGQVPMEAPELE